MIIYKLICKDCEISFDSWFSSSKEYEKLKKKKFLNCHFCNSLNVGKGLMSPSVSTSKNNLIFKKLDGMKFNIMDNSWKVSDDTSINYITKFLKN